MKRFLAVLVLASFMSGLSGCFVFSTDDKDPSSNKCHNNSDCKAGKVCVQGVCQAKGKAAGKRR